MYQTLVLLVTTAITIGAQLPGDVYTATEHAATNNDIVQVETGDGVPVTTQAPDPGPAPNCLRAVFHRDGTVTYEGLHDGSIRVAVVGHYLWMWVGDADDPRTSGELQEAGEVDSIDVSNPPAFLDVCK